MEFEIFELTKNGMIMPCATFNTLEKAMKVKKQWEEQSNYTRSFFIERR